MFRYLVNNSLATYSNADSWIREKMLITTKNLALSSINHVPDHHASGVDTKIEEMSSSHLIDAPSGQKVSLLLRVDYTDSIFILFYVN